MLQFSSNSSGEPLGSSFPPYQMWLPLCLCLPAAWISRRHFSWLSLYSGREERGRQKKMWSSTHFATRPMLRPRKMSAPASATMPYTPPADVKPKLLQVLIANWSVACRWMTSPGVTVDPVTSKKAPQSGPQRERESTRSVTNSKSRSNSRRKGSRTSRRSPGHHAT